MFKLEKASTILLLLVNLAVNAQKNNKGYTLAIIVSHYNGWGNDSIVVDSTGSYWDWYIDSVNVCVTSIDGKMKTCHYTDTTGITKLFTGLGKKNIVTCTKGGYDTTKIIVDLSKSRDSSIIISTDSLSQRCGSGWDSPIEKQLTISLNPQRGNKNSRHGERRIYSNVFFEVIWQMEHKYHTK